MQRRVLFVLSRDYGELFNARYFADAQPFASTFVLPPDLYAINHHDLDHPCQRFDAPQDVIRAVTRERPDAILLFSGYLYAVNGIMRPGDLAGLIDALRRQPVPVCTSDPSNGLLARVSERTIDERRPGRRSLVRHLAWLSDALAPLPHLYAAPPARQAAGAHAFFNPSMRWPSRQGSAPAGDAGAARWLFVLSSEDHEIQRRRHGRIEFAQTLARKLRETRSAGRVPLVVAPRACLADLRAVGVELDPQLARDSCSISRFMALLRDAEHVFYWNLFSASLLARGINGRSFFSFAHGHLSDIMPGFFERARGQFYADRATPLLDVDRPLDAEALDARAAGQAAALEPARARLARSPSPAELLELLIAKHGARRKDGQAGR